MKKNYIPEKKGMKRDYYIKQTQFNSEYLTEIEQVIDYNEEEIVITSMVKMSIKDKDCQKLLKTMEEKQTSPLVQVLKKIESDNRHDVKHEENGAKDLYFIPDDIKNKLNNNSYSNKPN